MSGQLRWKIELIHAYVIVQVSPAVRTAPEMNVQKSQSGGPFRERPLNVSNLEMGFKCCVPFNLVAHQSQREERRIRNILIAPFC